MKRFTYNRLKEIVEAVNQSLHDSGIDRKFTVYAAYGKNSVREVLQPGNGQAYYGKAAMVSPRQAAEFFADQLLLDGYEFEGRVIVLHTLSFYGTRA